MATGRRTDQVLGWVNFPVNSKEFVSSKEGGMFVRLVVYSEGGNGRVCCGGNSHVVYDESLIGDDVIKDISASEWSKQYEALAKIKDPEKMSAAMTAVDCLSRKSESFHFPRMEEKARSTPHNNSLSEKFLGRYTSIPYDAVLRMGSTGWSGYSQKSGYWKCKYSDLTTDGKALYNSLKRMYPKAKLYLQTWLDT